MINLVATQPTNRLCDHIRTVDHDQVPGILGHDVTCAEQRSQLRVTYEKDATGMVPSLERHSVEELIQELLKAHDSRRFAFPGLSGGNPVLTIVDATNGHKEREIEFKALDEILNPTWAPDGNRLAFTGMSGGTTDLFIYDLQASQLRRVTSDAYSELQPSWSPDGRAIAIATDRFSTNLGTLHADRGA